MPRCLRIIKVVPRDVGNRMKKIKLLSRGCLRCRAMINAMISQEDTPHIDETLIKSNICRYVSSHVYTRQYIHYLSFPPSFFNLLNY